MANWENNPAYTEAVARLSRNLNPSRYSELKAITRTLADKDTRDRINFVTETARRKRDADSLNMGQDRLALSKTSSALNYSLKKDALNEEKKSLLPQAAIGLTDAALKGYFGNEEKKRDLLFAKKIINMGKKYDNPLDPWGTKT